VESVGSQRVAAVAVYPRRSAVGLYTLRIQLTHSLKAPGLNPGERLVSTLKSEKLVSKFAFEWVKLAPLRRGEFVRAECRDGPGGSRRR
jgi:hypothetical protein